MLLDNIAALSTPIGVGGVAVIRISGNSPLDIAQKMFRPLGKTEVKDFTPYMLYVGEIDGGDFTDFGMCVYFRAPRSYTGEDMIEFHCHGGTAITRGILKRAYALGCKPATRGEFTKRAFMNGKLSLSSAEGLIDMINSESIGEVKAGYYLYRERLTREIRDLQGILKESLSLIDANIDFPEEGVEEADAAKILKSITEVKRRVGELSATYARGRKISGGVKVAIVGRPNTGKSSLLNSLLLSDRAIVSPVAGTTRDVVAGTLMINGVKYELFDTAGIRDSADGIEAEGVSRSKKVLESSDVALVVIDGRAGVTPEDEEILSAAEGRPRIVVCNKADAPDFNPVPCDVTVSALTGENIGVLADKISEKVFGGEVDLSGEVISEERHFYALEAASKALDTAANAVNTMPLDAAAVDITAAWQLLGEITGETASESIIDDIFSRFCVGK